MKHKGQTQSHKPDTEAPRLTRQVRRTMTAGEAYDPIAAQYVADPREETVLPVELADPIGDDRYSPVTGIVHRYADRLLLKITDTCAVYCRFCFRKEMVGKGKGVLSASDLDKAIAYIETAPNVREVILTGGDPLTLSNRRLENLFARLAAIDHVDIIRIHSRSPVSDPDRIDEGLLSILAECDRPVYLVIHVNHAREIDETVQSVFRRLSKAGIVLLSQSVLLKGVNDSVAALEDLFRALIRHRVKPYYLHHPDLAPGTGHFRLTIQEGQSLMQQLQGRLSGIAMPRYVLDIPGGYDKVSLSPSYAHELESGLYAVTDYRGQTHYYPPKAPGEGSE